MLLTEHRRTCFACSPGGHRAELLRAVDGIEFTDRFDATFRSDHDDNSGTAPAPARIWYLCHPRRSPLRLLLNILQTLVMICRERPHLIISTGADVALATVVFGRLFGAKVIFIESAGSFGPTLSGRLAYPFAHLFIIPWPEQRIAYPRAVIARGLLF